MGRSIGDELFTPLAREIKDLHVRMGTMPDVLRGLKHKKKKDRDGVTETDNADIDAPDPVSPRDYVRGNGPDQPRNSDGKPDQYSVYYEMTLDEGDWAQRRSVHFNRANADLESAMNSDPDFKNWLEECSPGIHDRVTSTGGRKNPDPNDFIWHHAHPDTVDGRYGVMQLVPRFEHTPGSDWWRVLHPGNNGGGGFAIWGKK